MAKRTKNLFQWCEENGRDDIMSEAAFERDLKKEYNSSIGIEWKCEKGHKWRCEVAARTLFGLRCPKCYPEDTSLPVGTKYGCLTIIGGYDIYLLEVIEPKEKRLLQEKERFLNGNNKTKSNVKTVEFYDRCVSENRKHQKLKCQCKCGKIQYLDQGEYLRSKRKYCTEAITEERLKRVQINDINIGSVSFDERIKELFCGLAVQAWKEKQKSLYDNGRREYAKNYEHDYSGTRFESLDVLECINDKYEERYAYSDRRKKDAYCYRIYKIYRCRCYLCGKEQMVKCTQFHISAHTQYGATAYKGYWGGVQCNCHKISSFQWLVNKILMEHDISYRVEYSFSDLLSIKGNNELRFDFAIMNDENLPSLLIECQGEQHYKPIEEFGGVDQYKRQVMNDEQKREYAKNHNIPLVEISYKTKKKDEIEEILRSVSIIG